MKKSIILIIACTLFNISNAQEKKANGTEAPKTDVTVVFDKPEHDFGTISESKGAVEYKFSLTNTGNQPLVISKVTASCGCTATDWSKEPIAPGAKGFVKATFDPKGKKDAFIKSLTVYTNGNPSSTILRIKGVITAN